MCVGHAKSAFSIDIHLTTVHVVHSQIQQFHESKRGYQVGVAIYKLIHNYYAISIRLWATAAPY